MDITRTQHQKYFEFELLRRYKFIVLPTIAICPCIIDNKNQK